MKRANANRSKQEPPEARAFDFLERNERDEKPRHAGLTEIRGPYYTPMGVRYLEDVLGTMGAYVDSLKFAGGSFRLFPKTALKTFIETAHRFEVRVCTGGFIERVLSRGADLVDRYIAECAEFGFGIIEISSGCISIPTDACLRLINKVQAAGLEPKPEVGIQFGAGGASPASALEEQGVAPTRWAIDRARRFVGA